MQQENEIITDGMGKKYFDLLRKKILWEEYTYFEIDETLEKVIRTILKLQIPSKNNIRYQHIKSFAEHCQRRS